MSEYTVKEFAFKEKVTTRTVYGWISKGLIQRNSRGRIVTGDPVIVPADRHGYTWSWFSGVYFIHCDGFIKIGYAQDVRLRLDGLASSSPHPLQPIGFICCPDPTSAQTLEASLHNRFSHLHHHREWFRDAPEVRDFIRESASLWPVPKRGVQ